MKFELYNTSSRLVKDTTVVDVEDLEGLLRLIDEYGHKLIINRRRYPKMDYMGNPLTDPFDGVQYSIEVYDSWRE